MTECGSGAANSLMMPTPRKDVMTHRCGFGLEEGGEGADEIAVGVGEPDLAQLGRVDDRRQGGHELGGAGHGAGVDQDFAGRGSGRTTARVTARRGAVGNRWGTAARPP